ADAGTLREIGVRPHLHDLVEGANLRVPERGEGRVLLAVLVGFAVALLDLGQAARLEGVGPDLVDHGRASIRVTGEHGNDSTGGRMCPKPLPVKGPRRANPTSLPFCLDANITGPPPNQRRAGTPIPRGGQEWAQ